jgi:hypothetical protein
MRTNDASCWASGRRTRATCCAPRAPRTRRTSIRTRRLRRSDESGGSRTA